MTTEWYSVLKRIPFDINSSQLILESWEFNTMGVNSYAEHQRTSP